jgi:hypothetical protein
MKALSLFFVGVFALATAHADVLTLTPDTKKIKNVNLSQSAVAVIDGADVSMVNVGSGMRKKYLVPFLGTEIYVAQIFAAEPEEFLKSAAGIEALESLKNQSVSAVRLDFVFGVSADQVFTAFVDALKANSVDLEETVIASFLATVKNGGDAKNGSSMTFLMSKNDDGSETLVYEDPNGVTSTVAGNAGFGQQILSMWLGVISPNDKGLKELKDQLTK